MIDMWPEKKKTTGNLNSKCKRANELHYFLTSHESFLQRHKSSVTMPSYDSVSVCRISVYAMYHEAMG